MKIYVCHHTAHIAKPVNNKKYEYQAELMPFGLDKAGFILGGPQVLCPRLDTVARRTHTHTHGEFPMEFVRLSHTQFRNVFYQTRPEVFSGHFFHLWPYFYDRQKRI